MFLGKVEALEHESIQTKFFVLGLPLIPMESFYVVAEDVQGVQGQALKDVHGGSALAGYVRIALPTIAFVSGIFAYVDRDAGSAWLVCAACTIGFVASMMLLGRLDDTERAKRECLLRLMGTGAPPELLEARARNAQLERLEAIYAILDDRPWREHVEDPAEAPADLLKLLYAIARYDGHPEADALWARIADGQAEPLRAPAVVDEEDEEDEEEDDKDLDPDDEDAVEDDDEVASAPRRKKRRRRPKPKREPCPACDVLNRADAAYCKACGEALAVSA
ncbi:MAG: zinc ribbon domain-containing protein [Polyangiaceae bacterium]